MKTLDIFLRKLKHRIVEKHKPCNGTGWITDTNKMCKCMKQFAILMDYKNAGIDPEYWGLSINDWKRDAVTKDVIAKYIEKIDTVYDKGYGLILVGKVGVGKTLCSSLILKSAVQKHYTVLNMAFSEFMSKIRYAPQVKEWIYKDFVCIDNVSYVKMGDREMMSVDEFFRARIRLNTSTFITSNLDIQMLEEMFGPSIMSVLKMKCKILPIEGKNYREELAKKIKF